MKASEGPIFEYACHEGNYSMFNVLTGARAVDRRRARSLLLWIVACVPSVLAFLSYRLRAFSQATRASRRPTVEQQAAKPRFRGPHFAH